MEISCCSYLFNWIKFEMFLHGRIVVFDGSKRAKVGFVGHFRRPLPMPIDLGEGIGC